MMITLRELDQVEAFKPLSNDQLAAVQKHCLKEEFKRGDRLFKEGDPATHLWIVMDGQVDLRFELPGDRPTSTETTLSSVTAEEDKKKVFGWSCFVPPYHMRLSAYCVSRSCSVIKIPKEGLLELFEKDPQMGYLMMSYLIKVVGYRFNQFQDEVAKHKGHDILNAW